MRHARARRRRPARAQALRRPPQRAAHLGGARGRSRRDRVRARQARHLRGLGGLGRPARAARRVPPRAARSSTDRYGYESALYGHYGQGCVHARWNFDLVTREGIATWRRFMDEAADLVLSLGGSLSGEHGDGQSRAELLPKMFGDELVEAFREFKSIWDPDWKMNPGKVVDPRPIDLRPPARAGLPPARRHDAFRLPRRRRQLRPRDHRCVGVGKCRRTEGGVMCPSYMVTREEKHSTRGRARLLWEMLNGDELAAAGTRPTCSRRSTSASPARAARTSARSTSTCRRCKAEYLSHHYARRLRPRHAYAFGLIDRWARLASRAPGLANLVTQTPGLSALAKAAAGVSQERRLPPFAPRRPPALGGATPAGRHATGAAVAGHLHELLRARERRRRGRGARGRRVRRRRPAGPPVLRPAALRLRLPRRGPPLPRAHDRVAPRRDPRGHAARRARAELRRRLPRRAAEDAARRRGREAARRADVPPRRVPRRAGRLRAAARSSATSSSRATATPRDRRRRARAGAARARWARTSTRPTAAAAAWPARGATRRRTTTSRRPAASAASSPPSARARDDALVVADGFSCRHQIEQGDTGRRAIHLAQALRLAREHGPRRPARRATPSAPSAGSTDPARTRPPPSPSRRYMLVAWGRRRRRT